MTIRLHTTAALSNPPSSKTLVEGAVQDIFVTKSLATREEDPSEEPNPNNNLGESYVAEIQQKGIKEFFNLY